MSAGGGSHADRVERFRLLYDAAYPRIMAYALRRARSREDALDAVSDTFMAVWRRLDDVPEEPRSIPWVYGVAHRVLANQYRGLDRLARLTKRVEATAAPEPQTDPDFDQVHRALQALRPGDREILTLHAWEELDNDEIGVVMGITRSAVAVRLHRAKKRLAWAMDADTRVKSTKRSRTPGVVYGTQPGPGEVDRQ